MNAIDKTTLSRRGFLAGMGGMSFAIAVGSDGAHLFASAPTRRPRRRRSTPGCASRRTGS